jgi:hypothetical protein
MTKTATATAPEPKKKPVDDLEKMRNAYKAGFKKPLPKSK